MAKQKRFRVKVELEGTTIVTVRIPVMATSELDATKKLDRMSNKRLMVKANRQLGRKLLWSIEECCFV